MPPAFSAATAETNRRVTTGRRRLLEAGAAFAGVAAGVVLAEPVLAAAVAAWHGFFLPAYDELIKNGLLAWCM
ncbi:MAG TPA: hypothetical protein VIF14_18210 [Alphaproteobacteria bacterium]|jgi:hypothetical protein